MVSSVQAAQDGRIVLDEVTIHEAPDSRSPVLNRIAHGNVLRMATRSSNGWYKVSLPQPSGTTVFGYVEASQVVADTVETDLNNAGIVHADPVVRVSERRHWLFRPYYELLLLNSTRLATAAGSDQGIVLGHSFGGEFGYLYDGGISLGLRGGYSIATAVGTTQLSVSSAFTGLFCDYEYFFQYPFSLGVGSTIGAAFMGTVVAPEGTVRFWFAYWLGNGFGVSLGGGVRYLNPQAITLQGESSALWLGGGFAQVMLLFRM